MAELRIAVGGGTPPTPALNTASLYLKSDKRFYMQDDTGAEVKLLTDETTLASLSVQAPLLTTGGANPTLSVSPVTTTANGTMLFADKVKLNNSTNNNTPSTIVQRDASGNFSANQITAVNFNGTASNVTTIPILSGAVTSTGTSNLTSLGTGVVVNSNISASANIQISKLEVDPRNRSTHTGTQDANTLTNLGTAVDAHLASQSPIVDSMIDATAAIAISKLAVNPLNRANHTGVQLANTISDFDVQVDTNISDYLIANPIDNNDISPSAAIALTKLATNPLARANHTGTQPSSTITNFNGAVAGALTGGDGITVNLTGELDVVGTLNRITATPSGVDIASNYVGQTSITTVGTVTSGTWNATIIPIAYGGTGAATAGSAANKLLAVTSVSTSVTLNNNDGVVLVDATGGIRTITLPLASTNYKYVIKKIDSTANTVVINCAGGNTIEGASSRTLSTQYQFETLVSNGTTWYLV
jgi:hypothetical protein